MARCIKKGCERPTEEDSNYCADHQPGSSLGKKVLKVDRGQGSGRGTASKRGGGKPGPRPPPK